MSTLTVYDETTGQGRSEPIEIEFLTDHVSVEELIRQRVYQEVKDFNVDRSQVFRGLVQPTDSEPTADGFKVRKPQPIDWHEQFDKACEAFRENRFILLVGDRQAESLDERITVEPAAEVTFLKLVPLVGG